MNQVQFKIKSQWVWALPAMISRKSFGIMPQPKDGMEKRKMDEAIALWVGGSSSWAKSIRILLSW